MAIDDAVLPLAERLLACLCEALTDTIAGPPCVCCLYHGASTPMDYCNDTGTANGQAWVRVTRIFPATARFPTQAFEVTPCKIPSWGAELVMGVYRCVSTLEDDGGAPPCDVITADAAKLLNDAAAMRRAAVCCFPEDAGTLAVVGAWEPIGPAGGCAGGLLPVTVQFCECCPAP